MAAKRKSTGTKRKRSATGRPRRESSVSFVGRAINGAIVLIRLRGRKLPPKGRAAVDQAIRQLKECRDEIAADICDGWVPKD
jgi:hypothetical protein